jgi:hypothetical protein
MTEYTDLIIDGSAAMDVESNADWVRAARLKKLADQGDEEAKKELKRMEENVLVRF